MELFIGFKPKERDMVVFVGCHAVSWRERKEPTMAFIPVETAQLDEFARLCRQYPDKAAWELAEHAFVLCSHSREALA